MDQPQPIIVKSGYLVSATIRRSVVHYDNFEVRDVLVKNGFETVSNSGSLIM
jgi:hypothetical protein